MEMGCVKHFYFGITYNNIMLAPMWEADKDSFKHTLCFAFCTSGT